MKENKKKYSLLKLYRLNLGQDIRTFSRGCAIGENLFGKYEKRYCAPSLANFYKICLYLKKEKVDIDIEKLMYDFANFTANKRG